MTGCLALSSILGGCSSDTDIENSGEVQINGNMGTLTFTIGDSDFSNDPLKTRSAVQSDTIYEELGDGYVMETVITPESESTLTRAGTTAVKDGVKILVIAYRGVKLYKREVATVQSGKFSVHLPAGETFKLLFYSYNKPGESAPTGYFRQEEWIPGTDESGTDSHFATDAATLVIKTDEIPRDMMWTKLDALTVTVTSKLPSIDFKHLFCKVNLKVSCDDPMTAIVAVLGPQTYSNATVDISTGSWTGAGNRVDSKIETLLTSGESTNMSNSIDLIPFESGNLTLKYEKITIKGKDYKTNVGKDLGKEFKRGNRYTINSKVTIPSNTPVEPDGGGDWGDGGEIEGDITPWGN